MAANASGLEIRWPEKKKSGVQKAGVSLIFLMQGVARPERFELPTPRFEAWCSIQLSYGRRPSIIGMHRIQVKLERADNDRFLMEIPLT